MCLENVIYFIILYPESYCPKTLFSDGLAAPRMIDSAQDLIVECIKLALNLQYRDWYLQID